jgi:hypothetical protein
MGINHSSDTFHQNYSFQVVQPAAVDFTFDANNFQLKKQDGEAENRTE